MKTTIFGALNIFIPPLYFVLVNHPLLRFSMKFHGMYAGSLHLAMSNNAYSASVS